VLADLTDAYPILSTLVERSPGGQRKLPFGHVDGGTATPLPLAPTTASQGGVDISGSSSQEPDSSAEAGLTGPEPSGPPPAPSEAPELPHVASVEPFGPRGPRRPARLGLTVGFESRPDDPELGVLRESTVWINSAHPAYARAAASRSEGYHVALTAAMTLARLAVEPHEAHAFVTAFLSAWGAMGRNGR
jgi:hypothetical protein